jgi:hypothetical protein
MLAEVEQLYRKKVFVRVSVHVLSNTQQKKILRPIMFMKKKRDGRIKSRLAADGQKQDRLITCIVDVSSPTVSIESVLMMIAIAVFEGRFVVTMDVEDAYLHCDMVGEVYVELDSAMTEMTLLIVPE